MKLDFELTKEDYINFNMYHTENSEIHKKSIRSSRIIMPLAAMLFVFLIGAVLFPSTKMYWGFICILSLLVMIRIYPNDYKKSMRKGFDKFLQDGDNSTLYGKKTLEIFEDYFIIEGEGTSERVLKQNIKNIKISEELILLYNCSFAAYIIPRRFLNQEIEKELLEALRK